MLAALRVEAERWVARRRCVPYRRGPWAWVLPLTRGAGVSSPGAGASAPSASVAGASSSREGDEDSIGEEASMGGAADASARKAESDGEDETKFAGEAALVVRSSEPRARANHDDRGCEERAHEGRGDGSAEAGAAARKLRHLTSAFASHLCTTIRVPGFSFVARTPCQPSGSCGPAQPKM